MILITHYGIQPGLRIADFYSAPLMALKTIKCFGQNLELKTL